MSLSPGSGCVTTERAPPGDRVVKPQRPHQIRATPHFRRFDLALPATTPHQAKEIPRKSRKGRKKKKVAPGTTSSTTTYSSPSSRYRNVETPIAVRVLKVSSSTINKQSINPTSLFNTVKMSYNKAEKDFGGEAPVRPPSLHARSTRSQLTIFLPPT